MMNRPKFYVYLPVVFSLVLILGILIGSTLNTNNNWDVIPVDGPDSYSKTEEILKYIHQEYVDSVSQKDLIDRTITSMLENLDPHSTYISADELQANNEPLIGHFEGIGIEFNIVNDTLRVISAIPGGPSEKVGIKAGDKITRVNGENIASVNISNMDVVKRLKGKGGTKVKVTVFRRGSTKPIDFMITRGKIPLYSIDISYMLSPETGYIKISRFAATTHEEYLTAFAKLKKQGMKKLIVDLRGNGGGYLNTAVDIADEFLKEGKEIVYTQGKARRLKTYTATSKGDFENGSIAILIDGGSASASEILAGAIQDSDRGVIVGRRSFGKGLVQEQTEFSDGSGMRLTIARYYTPTGRCIQKPYEKGNETYYEEEGIRFESGELQNKDSIKVADSLKYITPGGKIVYGGGGIIPDIFVPIDTFGHSNYLSLVSYMGIINDFAFEYADKERKNLKRYKNFQHFNTSFTISDPILKSFVDYAEKNGVSRNNKEIKTSEEQLKVRLKALISRNIFQNEGYYPILHQQDPLLKKAIEALEK